MKIHKVAFIGSGRAAKSMKLSLESIGVEIVGLQERTAQLLVIAVPDKAIWEVADSLADLDWLPRTVTHLSGVLGPRTSIAQFHPLCSLNGTSAIPQGALIGISALDNATEDILLELASTLRLLPVRLKAGSQVLYHTAACLTGNLSLALVAKSIELFETAHIPEEIGRPALAKLLRSVADSVEKLPVAQTLTGPVARKDQETIHRHVQALHALPEGQDWVDCYQFLSDFLKSKLAQPQSIL